MIIVVGGIKGGTGKTTLATNLAVLRVRANCSKVLLVDADEQGSTSDWGNQRGDRTDKNFPIVCLSGKNVNAHVMQLYNEYDDIIIDTGGRDTTTQRSALTVAHTFLLPFKPRSLDIWTLGTVKTLIGEIKLVNPDLRTISVINQADAKGSDNDEALALLKEHAEFMCSSATIGNRKAFSNAASQGLSVIEMEKIDAKAVEEISHLYKMIYG